MPSLFGTRASLLVDIALSVFVVMPVLLFFVARQARRGKHGVHRAWQLALFALMTVAVVMLEVDIRLAGGTAAIAGRAASTSSGMVRTLLLVHIAVACATWLSWLGLLILSNRRFRETRRRLPGQFSRAHRRLGWATIVGAIFNAASGTVLYVFAFT